MTLTARAPGGTPVVPGRVGRPGARVDGGRLCGDGEGGRGSSSCRADSFGRGADTAEKRADRRAGNGARARTTDGPSGAWQLKPVSAAVRTRAWGNPSPEK